jgi:hypothetical protein
MTHCSKVKARNLRRKLLSLDIDEGLRIENRTHDIRLFVNKSASGIFVLQLCNHKNGKENSNNNFFYFDSDEKVIKFIKSKFEKNFTIWSYWKWLKYFVSEAINEHIENWFNHYNITFILIIFGKSMFQKESGYRESSTHYYLVISLCITSSKSLCIQLLINNFLWSM